jgi:hypothetical protein
MSSSEAVNAEALVFSFTLHYCFVGNTDRMVLKFSSLSFSAALSLTFCTLIHWIILLWLGVSPGAHQRGAGAVLDAVVFEILLYPEPEEIGWSGSGKQSN